MTAASDRAAIASILDQYDAFSEYVLREVRLVAFGTVLQLVLDEILSVIDPADFRHARAFVLELQDVESVEMTLPLPADVIGQPAAAEWPLAEIARIRLGDDPTEGVGTETVHSLVIEWLDSDRRIEASFRRLAVSQVSKPDDAQRPDAGERP